MITSLMPYPAMMESGVPWLGDVPTHWSVQKLRRLLRPTAERNRSDLALLSVVREKGVIRRDMASKEGNRNFIPDDLSNYKVVAAGQFAINKMKAWQGSYGVSPYDGIVSPAYFTFVVSGISSRFFHSAIRSRAYVAFFAQASDGVRIGQWDLSPARMKEIPFFVPSRPEQALIVRFLDRAEREIALFIRAKQKLIKLLEEQKQTIIDRAVTRGLDPEARFRPSGMGWLGDVPDHWRVERNGRLFAQRNETGFAELPILEVSLRTGVPIRKFETSDRKQLMRDRDKHKRAVQGDIADNMRRMWQGALGVAPVDGLVSPAYVVARPRPGVEPHYFSFLFRTPKYMAEVDKYSRGIVKDRNRLYWEDFKQMPSPCPPIEEQGQIVDAIAKRTSSIDDGARRLLDEIELAREWRTRLIADVVTGKVDVREVAAALPDEPADSEGSWGEIEAEEEAVESDGEEVDIDLVEIEA